MSTTFEKYGGFKTVSRVVLTFYEMVLDDDVVGHHFDDVDMAALGNRLTRFAYAAGADRRTALGGSGDAGSRRSRCADPRGAGRRVGKGRRPGGRGGNRAAAPCGLCACRRDRGGGLAFRKSSRFRP